jgi:hypothetical protein
MTGKPEEEAKRADDDSFDNEIKKIDQRDKGLVISGIAGDGDSLVAKPGDMSELVKGNEDPSSFRQDGHQDFNSQQNMSQG